MKRPKISDYTKDLLASYDQLSDYSCSQDKFIDQVKAEKKDLTKALEKIRNLSSEAHSPLLKAIHQIAHKTFK